MGGEVCEGEWTHGWQWVRTAVGRVSGKVVEQGQGIAWGGCVLNKRDTKRCRGDSWWVVRVWGKVGWGTRLQGTV